MPYQKARMLDFNLYVLEMIINHYIFKMEQTAKQPLMEVFLPPPLPKKKKTANKKHGLGQVGRDKY